MEAPSRVLRRNKSRRYWCLSIAVALLLVVIVAIVIPLAVILPRKHHHKGIKSTVIVPLYIYPEGGAWNPLFDAVAAHPKLDFTVVVNPESGPGSTQFPNDDYIPAIQKLNAYSNVRTIGYVRTAFATRNITAVLSDVATYAGWSGTGAPSGIGMHGIFFDEVASEYSPETATSLKTINQAVKSSSGLLSDKLIVHNPGMIPQKGLEDPSTDVTVVFEETYQHYHSETTGLQALTQGRSRYSYIIHSVPENMGKDKLRDYVNDLSHHAQYLFLTDLSKDYYESFGPSWKAFTDVVPT